MRVVHVDTGRTMRGGQWQVVRLIEGLDRLGVEQLLLAREPSPPFAWAKRRGIARARLSFWSLRDAASDADLFHAHDARAHTFALLAGPPVVVARRVGFPVRLNPLSRWKYRRAAHFIAVSEFARSQLLRAGVPSSKVTVVYDAVPLPEQLSDRRGPVVAPASDDPRKSRALLQRSAVDVRLSADLPADLLHASALLYLSEMEGLGSAALLALAHGVPVVASRVGGLPEIVRHEETGLLVDNHPASVRQAVSRLLAEPELAARCIARGRALVEARHTVEQMVHATLAVYRTVLAG